MPTAAYELLPSSSRRQQPFEASGSTRIATPTSLGRPSSAGDRLRLLVALGCKNPWLALLVLLGSLALLHELFTVGTYVYAAQRALLPGDEPIAKHAVSKEGAAWADLVGNYSYGSIATAVPGAHFRDLHPIQSVAQFLALAEREIATLGLSTCEGKLGKELASAYNSTATQFCAPRTPSSHLNLKTDITCMMNYHSPFLQWWPYPASYCLSSDIMVGPRSPSKGADLQAWRLFQSHDCAVTPAGELLLDEMGGEKFLGNQVEILTSVKCEGGRIEHPLMFHGRQDQWNPFHVAEDFVTTFLAMAIAGLNDPSLLEDAQRLQLVFTDEFEVSKNHFTTVWDRIGSYPPRRMSLEPFSPKTCITKAIHSIGAGASLLSAPGVDKQHYCASSLTWGAGHYYRHLFGLPPGRPKSQAINVLWLSRAQMERIAHEQNDWSNWRETRHIDNEPQLLEHIRIGMRKFCQSQGCRFSQMDREPERWALDGGADDDAIELRFASIDPVTQAIETQIDFVGHATILVGLHGGSLGLSLFLPPGPQSTIIELKPQGTENSFHFQNMASELGVHYNDVGVLREVDVEAIWTVIRKRVEAELGSRRARVAD